MCNILFDDNSNVCSIYDQFIDICSRNVHDLDIYNVPRLNLNMLIDSLYATSYFTATVMLALYFTVLEIITTKMCITLTSTFTMGQGQM